MPSDGPSLAFDWEMGVFLGLRAVVRKLFGKPEQPAVDPARVVSLASVERKLAVVAQVAAGVPLRVRASPGAGGVSGRTLYLPAQIDLAEDAVNNAEIYLLRALMGAAWVRFGVPAAKGRAASVRAEVELAERAAALLSDEWPGFGPRYAKACARLLASRPPPELLSVDEAEVEARRSGALARAAGLRPPAGQTTQTRRGASPPVLLWGELLLADEFPDGAPPLEGRDRPPMAVTTELAAPPVDRVERVRIDARDLEDWTLAHTFEKVETADEFRGGARDLDGGDDLAEHGEALSEVKLGKLVRSDEDVHAVLRADVGTEVSIPDVEAIEPGEQGIAYDEWDHSRRAYRRAHCTVYPSAVRGGHEAWAHDALRRHRALIERLLRQTEARRQRLLPQRRQTDGERIDLDALVRHLGSVAAGEDSGGRLYTRQGRARRDLATVVLLDLSLSSDGWVDGRRVLDVAREAVLVLGEVADQLGEAIEVLGFASHTRNRCRVFTLRGPGEPWRVARARLGGLRPQGYTRIGAALRHATALATSLAARDRLLLLVSDGKPTDYDRYEGRYGVEDVRQAVREAEQRRVWVHALAVDAQARESLPAMLGRGRWHVLPSPEGLASAMAEVYGYMTAGR